ncbi:NAD(P)/FAD-dependent oxidoreductase [Phaeobacter marinintestinus]|uniref:NAD(P)/FAD-dependent oxidoreductase n=1 Tax=Falsiphaeobacter marinintestinus TaxID=1492905 RepID=UPI0011B6914E|nr:FAD-binding oxidoreductase [Phaeobacter marinintestinus]
MPGPAVSAFHPDPSLPAKVDVIVIGGGIIGTSTALELAERGLSVLICEKGQIGAEQSSRNWGWVRLSMRDPREIPLMLEAVRIWEGLDVRLGRKTGYRKTGILFTTATQKSYDLHARWIRQLDPHQIECRMVEGKDLDQLMRGHQMKVKGALHTPMDGRAEPQWVAPAIAEGARDRGAKVITGCAVRSLDIQAGRVTGVVTERGRVACDAVVLAGGAWSRLFAGNAGIELPQLKTLNTVMRTTAIEGGPEASIWAKGFALRKREDGGYTVASGSENIVDIVPDSFRLGLRFLPAFMEERQSLRFRLSGRWREEAGQARRWAPDERTPFELCRILDPEPSQRILRQSWARARSAFPVLESAEIVQSWAGMIDVTPDAIPVISPVEELPGLLISTGFSGHGFGIGPAAGKLAADLVTGDTPLVDPTPFRLSRFSDGSRIHL